MKLTKRERTIAIVVGVVFVLFMLDKVIISPYFDAKDKLDKDLAAAQADQDANTAMFNTQTQLTSVWEDLKKGGLTADESAADQQASQAAINFAQNAGIAVNSMKPERTTSVNQFQVIGFHISGTGTTPAVARMMYAFETASVPIRVDELVLSPMREGTDNLKIELTFSTVCQKAGAAADTNKTTVTLGGSEAQSWNE